jgi:type II secretory pathway pseudopilin PulG
LVTRAAVGNERGETYVELLMTLVVMGLVGAAILGAIMTSISSSSMHRNLSNDDSIMKSALEQAKYEIELAPTPLFKTDCSSSNTAQALLTSWNSSMTSQGYWPAIPPGIGTFKTWISQVECFTESSGSSSLDSGCVATQTASGGIVTTSTGCGSDSSGIVQVSVSVLDPSNLVTSLSTFVRISSYGSGYATSGNF